MKNFHENVQKNGPAGRIKDKTERITGLGSKTRKEIAKWNQITALRLQTGGGIRHPRPPRGAVGERGVNFEPSDVYSLTHENSPNMCIY